MTIAKQITDLVNKKVGKAIAFGLRKSFLESQGKSLAIQIKKRTQLGRVVPSENGPTASIAPLKPSTKRTRSRYQGRLANNTTPARSNLTATGQMLRSIFGGASSKLIFIGFKDAIKKTLTGRRSKVKISEVIDFHMEGTSKMPARPFFRVAEFEREEIERNIRKEVLKGLNL